MLNFMSNYQYSGAFIMSYKAVTKASYQATAEEFTHNVADLAPMESIQNYKERKNAKEARL